MIDHGAAPLLPPRLVRAESATRIASPHQPWSADDHVFREHAAELPGVDAELRGFLGESVFAEVLAEVPDEWLEPVPGAEDPEAVRAAYVDFLTARLGTTPVAAPGSGMTRRRAKLAYEYVVLRCVPRVDREEFLNVGVVLHCQMADFLDVAWHVDRDRLLRPRPADRRRPGLRGPGLRRRASAPATRPRGAAAAEPLTQRFGFLKAPRCTVLQPSPVHGGVTADPGRQLERLLEQLVG